LLSTKDDDDEDDDDDTFGAWGGRYIDISCSLSQAGSQSCRILEILFSPNTLRTSWGSMLFIFCSLYQHLLCWNISFSHLLYGQNRRCYLRILWEKLGDSIEKW
jgi:hypothetical protein